MKAMNNQRLDARPALGVFVGLAALKLVGITDVSWWVVSYPLLAYAALSLVAFVVVMLYRLRYGKD